MVELVIEMQTERTRVADAMKARDAAVTRLLDAYISARKKSELIEKLQKEREAHGLQRLNDPAEDQFDGDCMLKARIAELEMLLEEFREINGHLKEYGVYSAKAFCDPPPLYQGETSHVSLAWAYLTLG